MDSHELRRYLDRVEGHLQGPGKGDILREIESHVMDRAEALAAQRGAAAGPEDVRLALEELGDPSDLAVSYSGEKFLVAPKEYAAFWYFTLLVFAVHVTMLFVAFATRTEFNFFPFNVMPGGKLRGAGSALTLVSLSVQAFLFDAGLVLIVFFLLRRTFRRVDLPNLTFRVESSRRPSLVRAAFAAVLGVLLGVPQVRDFIFRAKAGDYGYTLFLPGWEEHLPFVLAFLGLAFAKDVLYALLHERVLTVALDVVAAVAGVVLFVYLFSRKPFVGLPGDFPLDESMLLLFNESLARVVGMALLLLAAIFAGRAVRRGIRVMQLWGEKDTARL